MIFLNLDIIYYLTDEQEFFLKKKKLKICKKSVMYSVLMTPYYQYTATSPMSRFKFNKNETFNQRDQWNTSQGVVKMY